MVSSKKIEIPLYRDSFTIVVYSKPEDITEFFSDYNVRFDPGKLDAFFIENNDDEMFLCFQNYRSNKNKLEPTPGTIAHEAKHLLNKIFKYHGIELDLDNDEPEAYLLGWLVDEIYNYINEI